MKMPCVTCLAVTALLAGQSSREPQALGPTQQSRTVFVGTTPCGDTVRTFVGGMPADAKCHAIKWELTLGTAEAANRWSLTAVYGIPPASNPNATIDGPKVTKQGTLTSSTVQRLGGAATVLRVTSDTGSTI